MSGVGGKKRGYEAIRGRPTECAVRFALTQGRIDKRKPSRVQSDVPSCQQSFPQEPIMIVSEFIWPFVPLLVGAIALGFASDSWAAKAPLSPERLKKEATHIVTGTVVEVSSKKQKSEFEKGFGIHVDQVFTIKLKVESIVKGEGLKVDGKIEIEARKPIRRIPAWPGLQGSDRFQNSARP